MILDELKVILEGNGFPTEFDSWDKFTGDNRAVLTPMGDDLERYGDNYPMTEVSSVRISLYVKGNYIGLVKKITTALLDADFYITDRRFIEHEKDTGYNHYVIDVEKEYDF